MFLQTEVGRQGKKYSKINRRRSARRQRSVFGQFSRIKLFTKKWWKCDIQDTLVSSDHVIRIKSSPPVLPCQSAYLVSAFFLRPFSESPEGILQTRRKGESQLFKEVLLQLNVLHRKTCWGIFQWKQPRLCAAVTLSNNLCMYIFLFTYLNSLELQGLRALINISGNVTVWLIFNCCPCAGATAIIAHMKHYKTRTMMHKT